MYFVAQNIWNNESRVREYLRKPCHSLFWKNRAKVYFEKACHSLFWKSVPWFILKSLRHWKWKVVVLKSVEILASGSKSNKSTVLPRDKVSTLFKTATFQKKRVTEYLEKVVARIILKSHGTVYFEKSWHRLFSKVLAQFILDLDFCVTTYLEKSCHEIFDKLTPPKFFLRLTPVLCTWFRKPTISNQWFSSHLVQ